MGLWLREWLRVGWIGLQYGQGAGKRTSSPSCVRA
jgi:hypothetical protein